MGRQVKDHETRRKEILETAERFFLTEGYESTSIQGIIDAIGIAKGTFYHYFKSKEELLREWLLEEISTVIEMLESIVNDNSLNVIERLTKMYSKAAEWKLSKKSLVIPAVAVFYDDKNIVLREKLNKLVVQKTASIYTTLIEEGNIRGEFLKPFPYPEVAAKIILFIGTAIGEDLAKCFFNLEDTLKNKDYILRHMKGVEYAMQRIIGVEDGSFTLYRYDLLDKILEGDKSDTH